MMTICHMVVGVRDESDCRSSAPLGVAIGQSAPSWGPPAEFTFPTDETHSSILHVATISKSRSSPKSPAVVVLAISFGAVA